MTEPDNNPMTLEISRKRHIRESFLSDQTMAVSLQAAFTTVQPTKVAPPSRATAKLRTSSQSVSISFGVDPVGSHVSCSLRDDLKNLTLKCFEATKIAGFAIATSALLVSVWFLAAKLQSSCFYDR